MQTVVVDLYDPKISQAAAAAAFDRVYNGLIKSPAEAEDGEFDSDAHDQWILRIVARGKIVARYREKYGDAYATHLSLVRLPELREGEVYAIRHSSASGYGNVYQCTEADAKICLAFSGAYNL